MTALEARGLAYRYPGAAEPALRGLDLGAAGGEVLGLLGPNGAGKTTALSLLAGVLVPSSGTVRVWGDPVGPRERAYRRHLGLVPQEIALYGALTARENLRFFGRLHGLGGAELEARVAEGLEAVGLGDRADRRVETYSGGMKRRANLAAGLVHRPRLLVLDEPTVGVDAQSRQAIFALLRRLVGEGTTLVYSTHYMEEAQALCTRVVILDEGRAVADGAPAVLLATHPGCANLEELFLTLTGHRLRD